MRTWVEMLDDLDRLTNELKDKWAEEMKAGGLVPSRPKGKWAECVNEEVGAIGGICSNCGKWVFYAVSCDLWGNKHTDNFCKYCGAEMEGEE